MCPFGIPHLSKKHIFSLYLEPDQDTRRLLSQEIDELRAAIFRAESAARVAAERENAEVGHV